MDYKTTDIRYITETLLSASGLTKAHARQAGDVFIRSQRRGMEHHDLSYLPGRLDWLFQGKVAGNAQPELLGSQGSLSWYDGHNALGELCCSSIASRAITDAQKYGIALSTVKNSNHFLAGAPYAEMGSENQCLLLVFSSTDATMAGPPGRGDTQPVIGNNPFAAGFPTTAQPFILDMCMAYASLGTLHKKVKYGEQVPSSYGYNAQGEPTSSPQEILEGGALSPMAGHKGFGLALLVEMLTGGLSGGHMGLDIPQGGGISGHSQTVIAVSLGANSSMKQAPQRFSTMMGSLADASPGVRYPGSRQTPDSQTLDVPREVLQQLLVWWDRLGIKEPWPL